MERTITIKQEIDIDMTDIANHLLGEINDYFVDHYNIDDPETIITDYDSVVTDILKFTLKIFDE